MQSDSDLIQSVHFHCYRCSVVATMALTVNVDKKPMLPIVAKAIDQLFHEPKDMFWTGRVMDVLYDGIPIDCSSTEFAATATCSMFKGGDVKAVKEIDEKTFSFSLFAGVSVICSPLIVNWCDSNSWKNMFFSFVDRQMEPTWVNSKCFVVPNIRRTSVA